MAVKRIVTNIATPQADAARRFYGAVLGLEVVMTFAAKGGVERPDQHREVSGRILAWCAGCPGVGQPCGGTTGRGIQTAEEGGNERSGVVGRIVARTRPATPRCGLAGTPTF